MRYWFDTEFIDDGRTIELISIGIVSEDGRRYYAESEECDLSRGCEWVQKNVIPHLTGPRKPRSRIAQDLKLFCGRSPEFWAYFNAYDWVALCQLYGRMLDTPEGWPNFCFDVQALRCQMGIVNLPEQSTTKHNALADAEWTREAFEYLLKMHWAVV
jgi:hypothetical protein